MNGSFVTSKALPNDYDGAWETAGVDWNLIDPILLDSLPGRPAMKAKYGGELLADPFIPGRGDRIREFFQSDRDENPKGILSIDLGSVT